MAVPVLGKYKIEKKEPSQYWESIKKGKTAFPNRGNTKTSH